MRFAVMIEGQEDVTWEDWLALARACERLGIEALLRSDHYGSVDGDATRGSLDAWGTICGLAAVTSTLRLGTLVSPATFRHPSVLAKSAVTADHISGGRIELGIGTGWNVAEHRAYGFPFPPMKQRMDLLAEQLEVISGSLGAGPFSFAGEHVTVDGARRAAQAGPAAAAAAHGRRGHAARRRAGGALRRPSTTWCTRRPRTRPRRAAGSGRPARRSGATRRR